MQPRCIDCGRYCRRYAFADLDEEVYLLNFCPYCLHRHGHRTYTTIAGEYQSSVFAFHLPNLFADEAKLYRFNRFLAITDRKRCHSGAASYHEPLPEPLAAAIMSASNQQVVPFVRWVDAMVDIQPVCETPVQVELPDWLVDLYRQIERELGRMEQFIRDSHAANQNAAEILPSLVEEYQTLLKTQHQLFDQAVNNNNQLLDLNRKQFGLIELKSLNFASHVEAALNLITSSASTEFENLRSRLEGQIQANVKLHSVYRGTTEECGDGLPPADLGDSEPPNPLFSFRPGCPRCGNQPLGPEG
jgi:hypothetical protein